MIKILSISTDRKIFDQNSAVRTRMIEYGALFEETHMVIFTLKGQGFKMTQINKNVFIYPTSSKNKLRYIFDAVRIARAIIIERGFGLENCILTSQDPFETGLVAIALKKLTNIKVQIQAHTDFLSSNFRNNFLNTIRYFIAVYTIKNANTIRVVSDRIKESIVNKMNISEKNIEVLPIFLDISKIKYHKLKNNIRIKYPKFNFFILVICRLEKEKNITDIIDMMSNITREFPKTALIIIGDGREKENLLKKVYSLGIKDNVFFEGWSDDVLSYLKTGDVLVVNSAYEGYGMTIVEAVASGCPVITTDVGISREYIKDRINGYICPVGENPCIESKLKALIKDFRIYDEMKKNSRLEADNLISDKDQYLEHYRKILESTLTK